jgi:CubicO group peptidase (beta-lactamase class C family)
MRKVRKATEAAAAIRIVDVCQIAPRSDCLTTMSRVLMGVMLALSCQAQGAGAQSTGGTGNPSPVLKRQAVAADYDGVYAYHGGTNLAIVSADSLLFAVLDEAKYPLRPIGADRFLNSSGDTIPFRRGSDGKVLGFVERRLYFARRTPVVDPAILAAVRAPPRAVGVDGRVPRYTYAAPADLNDGLSVGSISDAGLDTASVTRLVNRVVNGAYPDVHSVLVYRRGKLVVEEYFYEYDRDRPHQMRSATKSVVSALAGIAIDRGLLEGDGALVAAHLPYGRYANPDPRKERLTLHDLLTMRSGLACDDWNGASPGNESRVYLTPDWVKYVLDLPMIDAPGTRGHYCSGNVAVVGRIVERATGKALPAFAQENLFTPLGIRAEQVRWNYTLDSSNAATFAQLYLRPRDMLKFGVLFAQKGMWNGRQVISREWVERSTAKWSTVGDQEYGYFWWHQYINAAMPDGPRRVDMVLATGNGGQKIYLVPSLDLVVVMTGGNYNANSPATAIMANEILPALLKGSAAAK